MQCGRCRGSDAGACVAVGRDVFEAPVIPRHVAIREGDADARVAGKPAVLPGEHVARRVGVDESPEGQRSSGPRRWVCIVHDLAEADPETKGEQGNAADSR